MLIRIFWRHKKQLAVSYYINWQALIFLLNKTLMYVCVCMYVCMYVPGKLENLLADFDAVCFIALLKTTKVIWANNFFSKVKNAPKKDEKHNFCDARTS